MKCVRRVKNQPLTTAVSNALQVPTQPVPLVLSHSQSACMALSRCVYLALFPGSPSACNNHTYGLSSTVCFGCYCTDFIDFFPDIISWMCYIALSLIVCIHTLALQPGTYRPFDSPDPECQDCKNGYYQMDPGELSCNECPKGSYCPVSV